MEDDPRGEASEPERVESPAPKTEVRPARGRTFLPEITGVEFSSSRRGYDRAEVDQYVERISRIVVELEAMRSPDAVIERALADVGEETSAILRRARKAAEEIIADAEADASERTAQVEATARQLREDADLYSARVKAEGEQALNGARAEAERTLNDAHAEAEQALKDARAEAERTLNDAHAEAEQALEDARAEAEQIRNQTAADARRVREDADRYRDQVNSHIEQLARERHRLIEDLRKLADQFHRTADRAVEQIPTQDVSYERIEGNGDAPSAEAKSA